MFRVKVQVVSKYFKSLIISHSMVASLVMATTSFKVVDIGTYEKIKTLVSAE